jgi:hypothetical protein
MSPIYTYAQWGAVKQQLANRLYDSAKTFWSDAELGVYLTEALRTFNALAAFWRGDFTFPSVQGTVWYDLTDTVAMPNTLRPLTVTDADVYEQIEYHFLEPATGINPWTGSSQFSADDLLNAVQRRRDEILSIAGCTMTRGTVPAVLGRIQFPDTVIDVRRMAYLGTGQVPTTLWPEDAWAEQSFDVSYLQNPAGTPGLPSTYLLSTQPPISFDTNAPPAYAGSYEYISVNAGGALSITTPSTLSLPDDWTWLVKWGAMADLLSREAYAKDQQRAQYCEQRYRMGLKILESAPALLQMRVGNVPLQIDSLWAADLYNVGWQGQSQASPANCFHAGLNLIALSPPPSAGPFSLTATVVQNAPIPTADGDYIQAAREDLDAIIDYAEHLAAFKMGGAEFLATVPLLQRFLEQTSLYGLKLKELAEYTEAIYGLSELQENADPRISASSGAAS